MATLVVVGPPSLFIKQVGELQEDYGTSELGSYLWGRL